LLNAPIAFSSRHAPHRFISSFATADGIQLIYGLSSDHGTRANGKTTTMRDRFGMRAGSM